MPPTIKFRKLSATAQTPTRAHPTDSGMDIYSDEHVVISGLDRKVVDCGIAISLPTGYEGQVRPRSGLAAKQGLTVLNSPGTIDCSYRGPIKVILFNSGVPSVIIKPGDRIAQLVIQKVEFLEAVEVDSLDDTDRGSGGLGSTGL